MPHSDRPTSTTGRASNGLSRWSGSVLSWTSRWLGAGEEGPGAGDVEVIERLGRVGLDAGDPDQAAEGAQDVARLELAGHGPAEVGPPEPVIDAADHRVAVRERDPQGLAGRVVVDEDDGLEAQGAGGGVLAEDLVADPDRLDRPGAVERADGRPGGEAGRDRSAAGTATARRPR